MKLTLPKGTRDSLPEEKIGKQKLMDDLKTIFELYGYSPIDTPVIERFDVLASKYAGGAEILKETFKLSDQGKRELGLRYDLTVPFARVVGMNPDLKMPFKRYQIDKVWRDGPVGLGRYREFWQCDVDLVGTKSMMADAEVLAIAKKAMESFGLKCRINVNNRKVLNGLLGSFGVKTRDEKIDIILTIDKIKKISDKEFAKELSLKGLDSKQIKKIKEIFSIEGSNKKKLEAVSKEITDQEGKEGVKELEELFGLLDSYGITNYDLELSLSRGLAFYTGTVFETFLVNNEIKSAVASGGRYDDIIPKFLDSKMDFPAVGISFGLNRIYDALKDKEKAAKKTVTKVFVVPIGLDKKAISIVEKLRESGINSEIDLTGRGISKNLKYANSKGIPYVLIVGENELKESKFKLKDMISGEEKTLSLDSIISKIKK
ncbi:MAG: histidine--tRNA ligase [Candidatus Woesearchaeota archaeon]